MGTVGVQGVSLPRFGGIVDWRSGVIVMIDYQYYKQQILVQYHKYLNYLPT